APAYHGMVVHVKDASRSVGIMDRLTRAGERSELDLHNRREQEREREAFARRRRRKLASYAEAWERRLALDWGIAEIPRPAVVGGRVLRDFPLGEIVPYIDWSPFFMAWELKGKFPQILTDPAGGGEAKKLFADAQALLTRLVAERLLQAHAVYG